jgi:hypothetical protein
MNTGFFARSSISLPMFEREHTPREVLHTLRVRLHAARERQPATYETEFAT